MDFFFMQGIAEGEGSAAVERTGARSKQSWETVKSTQQNTPRFVDKDTITMTSHTHGD